MLILPSVLLVAPAILITSMSSGWSTTWKDILSGGNPRWKIDDLSRKQTALETILKYYAHANSNNANEAAGDDKPKQQPRPLSILCPLAGDDLFVVNAWKHGHKVTAIDFVSEAIEAMKTTFGNDLHEWKKRDNTELDKNSNIVKWTSNDNKITLYQANMLQPIPDLLIADDAAAQSNKFDVVYDKDSFGALEKNMRNEYCQRITDYTRPGSILYCEVKNRENEDKLMGPPFHITKQDLIEHFSEFEHVAELGEIYPLPSSMSGMKQMGHIMKRKIIKNF